MPSIDWTTFVITIPQSYLTLVSGTFYSLDTDQFRRDLRDIEDNTDGIVHPITHNHNTEVTVAGTTLARQVLVLNPYSIEFEDGQYSVQLTGSNNNIFDVAAGILNQNQVQVIPGNSAGLTAVLTPQSIRDAMALALSDTAVIEVGSIDRKIKNAKNAALS